MKNSILIFFLILLSCNQEKQNISDCSEITTPFTTYDEAKNTVESVDFKYTDEIDTSKSSWIRSAKYYSCDGHVGYLVYTTDKKEYIHQEVPVEVWEDFKNADSFGKFYNANIKDNYQMISEK